MCLKVGLFLLLFYCLCVVVLSMFISVHRVHPVLPEARRGWWILWNWSSRWLEHMSITTEPFVHPSLHPSIHPSIYPSPLSSKQVYTGSFFCDDTMYDWFLNSKNWVNSWCAPFPWPSPFPYTHLSRWNYLLFGLNSWGWAATKPIASEAQGHSSKLMNLWP